MHSLERYEVGTSPIHQLDPRVKVVITVLFILSNALLPDGAWLGFGLALLLALVVGWSSGLGLSYALKRSFLVLPFTLVAVTVIFSLPGRPLAEWQLGSLRIVPTDAGLLRFVSIVCRSWISIQLAILLAATTQFPDLMHALRHLKIPGLMVAIVSFMYRYLFVLSDETQRLLRAREARSARPLGSRQEGGTLLWRARVAGNMVGQLFLRSYERSERVYNAMLSRGYTGQMMTLNPHVMRRTDWVMASAAVVLLCLIQLAGWLG